MLMATAGFAALATIGGRRLLRRASQSSDSGPSEAQYDVEQASDGRFAVRRRSTALGSQVAITAIHEQLETAIHAIDSAFVEIDRVESVMSIYRTDSQLSRLNRDGRLDRSDPSLVEVLRHAAATSEASDGAFDVTVQPLWQLYADAQRQGNLPTDDAIAQARRLIDWRRVTITDERIELTGKQSAVTLNGIAQGYAADRALAMVHSAGVADALIDTGEFAPLGANRNGDRWSIGIQHPRDPQALVAVSKLEGRCLATSGDYATTFTDDRRFNHLFDPQTGQSPQGLASVSILAPTALQADALSTACFVLGLERARTLIESLEGVDAYFIPTSGESVATAGFEFA